MRGEGVLFLAGGSGGGTVFVPILGMCPRSFDRARSRMFAHVRDVPDALCP